MTAAVDSYVQNRPIRPLPKRKLRSRLSEEVQAEIELLAPSPTNPGRVFNLPFGPYCDLASFNGSPLRISTGMHTVHSGSQPDSEDEEDDEDYQPGGEVNIVGGGSDGGNNTSSGSGTSGSGMADNYDWVENTNNKKKRKIPSPVHPTGVTGMVSGGTNTSNITSQSCGFSPNGPNTTPRSRWKSSSGSQRSPLTASRDSNMRRMARRYPISPSEVRRRLFPTQGGAGDDSQSTDLAVDENVSNCSTKLNLAKPHQSQFTFEHITPASTSLALQAVHPNLSHQSPSSRDGSSYPKMTTVGTQTSPSISNSNTYPPPPTPKKKSGRNIKSGQQQRQRRQVSGAYGMHNNNNGEIWICEFCEYESIFGEPPEALMRQYDIKDRRERRKLREKQRLLDKAKQKGKKNPSKPIKKTSAGSHAQQPSSGNTPPPAPPPSTADSQGTQGDDTIVASTNAPIVSKAQKNSEVQTENLNVNSHHVSSGRGATSDGAGGGGQKVVAAGSGGCHSGGHLGSIA